MIRSQGLAPRLFAGIKGRRGLLIANLVSFIALALITFRLQSPVAFFRWDGTFLLTAAQNQAKWMAAGGVFSMNPLEGNAGMWFPTAMELIPGFAVGRLAGTEWMPAVAFTWFATEFFVATLILAAVIGLGWRTAAFGAWALALGVCPFIVPAPASERIWGNPHLLSAIAACSLALAVFIPIGRGRAASDAVCAMVAFLLLGYIGFSQPIMTVLAWPVFSFFAVVTISAARDSSERKWKIVVLGAVAVLLAVLFGEYLIGLFGYAKTTFFWRELVPVHKIGRAHV